MTARSPRRRHRSVMCVQQPATPVARVQPCMPLPQPASWDATHVDTLPLNSQAGPTTSLSSMERTRQGNVDAALRQILQLAHQPQPVLVATQRVQPPCGSLASACAAHRSCG
jgi:hypothetical protein